MRIETHAHTKDSSSCGHIPARELVRLNIEAGVDALVITDHYSRSALAKYEGTSQEKLEQYLTGWRNAKEEGEKLGLTVIFGFELRIDAGPEDFLVYGATPAFLEQYPELYTLSLQEVCDLCEANNLLIVQAHPFREVCRPQDPRYLHGIEIYNGHPRHDSRNDLALEYAEQHSIPIRLSGSDTHQLPDVARGGIVTEWNITDSVQLAQLLRSGEFELLKQE